MKQMVKGSSVLTAVSIGEMLMRFVRTKFIAIIMGPAGTGFLAQLVVFFEMIRVWGDLGSRRGVIKQIAEERRNGRTERYSSIIKTSYLLALLASGVVSLFIMLFSRYISSSLFGTPENFGFIIFLALLLPIASLSTVTASIVKGNLEYTSFAKYTFLSYGVVILVTPIFIYLFRDWGGVLTLAFFYIFPLISYLIYNKKNKFLSLSKNINTGALKEQVAYGSVQIYQDSLMQIARVLIATWIVRGLGLSTMGIYQVVMTFSTVYMAIPIQAMTGYSMPLMASAENPKEITRAINDSLRYLIFLLTPLIIFLITFPEFVISIFFSSDFRAAAFPLQIQLLGAFCLLIAFPFCVAFQAKGKLRAIMWISTILSVAYVGLSWLLFDVKQLVGISIAYFVINAINMIVYVTLSRQFFESFIVPKNQRLLWASASWVMFAFLSSAIFKIWQFQVLVFVFSVPWFLMSSKEHEREFLVSKIVRLKELKKLFGQNKYILKFLRR